MLRITVEKIMVFTEKGDSIEIPAGKYEQTIYQSDGTEIEVLRKIVAIVNHVKEK